MRTAVWHRDGAWHESGEGAPDGFRSDSNGMIYARPTGYRRAEKFNVPHWASRIAIEAIQDRLRVALQDCERLPEPSRDEVWYDLHCALGSVERAIEKLIATAGEAPPSEFREKVSREKVSR